MLEIKNNFFNNEGNQPVKQLANAFNQDEMFIKIFPTQFQTENIYFKLNDCKNACDFIMDGSVDLSAL